jgi:hypothetical protein
MKYTHTLEGDRVVKKDMEQIINTAKQADWETLVLYGAFGKGEGLVLNGVPRNDYDILMVGGKKPIVKKLESLDLGCEVEVLNLARACVRDVYINQQWYEIKYGSQLLAGKPLVLPDWEIYEIPYEDAISSLDKRCSSMLIGKYEMMKSQPDKRKVLEQICKMIIAIGDATLIKRGVFNHLYSVRSLMLSKDTIGQLYQLAVSIKTLGYPDITTDGAWKLWHTARSTFREYVVNNQIFVPKADLLLAITDRTTKKELKEIIKKIGAERWS